MKVLIVSLETWREDNNAGNVTTNLFSDSGFEFANIYCSPGEPFNSLCKDYYQMTDKMMLLNLFKGTKVGKRISYKDWPKNNNVEDVRVNSKVYKFFRKFNFHIFYLFRTFAWSMAKWENNDLDDFIESFKPDVIYSPCYGTKEMIDVLAYVKKKANVPVVSYLWDDMYFFKQICFEPAYWINRILFRKALRKNKDMFDLFYTMTDEQKEEMGKALGIDFKVLKKYGDFINVSPKESLNNPLRIIYAGNLLYGRWKTLSIIAESLREINKDSVKAKLEIYTGDTLIDKYVKLLNDGRSSEIMGRVSYDELRKIYKSADIALHVESFELKYKLRTRLAFSTKIIDCLESGCATIAVAWNQQAGYRYLKKHDLAFCIDDKKDIDATLKKIIADRDSILAYSNKAVEFGRDNLDKSKKEQFWDDVKALI
ncbi:Glycosyltransferase involved in cell wall bisynthesis [Pseudobutyrivibrio sp. UC1225]|uniref:glycosyltransferase n=1 Tax=Pseudobutyrivibrio sp. UC1225 TaxID=1798185 RepID=UPI0008ED7B1E|nr:glycosyltransferase [Pseudobutyrivibrio sp. UC1225]SFN78482.1 Glycosyltransferase involved in cell wall bisynthesis [Pseudobutyrivibrio sp. UC1225]